MSKLDNNNQYKRSTSVTNIQNKTAGQICSQTK